MPAKFIGKEAGNAVDTEECFVETVQVKNEMGIASLPGCKLRTFKQPTMKECLG